MNTPAEIKIYKCFERSELSIPTSSFISSSGQIRINPLVLGKGLLDVDFRGGELKIVAGKYIGLIPLNDEITLDIRPKVPLARIVELLNRSNEAFRSLPFLRAMAASQEFLDASLLQLLACSLLHHLTKLAQEGIWKEYVARDVISRGKSRILFGQSIQRHWARGNLTHTQSEVFSFTAETAANQVIKQAIEMCLLQLRATGPLSAGQAREFEFFCNIFERVQYDRSGRAVNACEQMLASNKIPTIRQYYIELLKLCLLILGGRSFDVELSEQGVLLETSIVDLEYVFERYLRRVLREALAELEVLDGNASGKRWLFHDNKKFEIKPDILIRRSHKNVLVMEVKYKRNASEADRYQVLTHAHSCNVRRACLLLPADETHPRGLTRLGQMTDANGVELYEYRFDLAQELEAEEQELVHAVLNLASASGGAQTTTSHSALVSCS